MTVPSIFTDRILPDDWAMLLCQQATHDQLSNWFAAAPEIGHGSFSSVRRAILLDGSGRVAAVKKFDMCTNLVPREVVALMCMKQHPNIACFLAVYPAGDHMYLAVECVDNADTVYKIMRSPEYSTVRRAQKHLFGSVQVEGNTRSRCMTADAAMFVVHGVATALSFAHQHGIAHRDVSAHNVLLSVPGRGESVDSCRVKLVDWGFAHINVVHGVAASERPGTLDFAAPELFDTPDSEYDPLKVDCWSLGVLAYYLLTGIVPFGSPYDSSNEEFMRIVKVICSRDALDPIKGMFNAHVECFLCSALDRNVCTRGNALTLMMKAATARIARK